MNSLKALKVSLLATILACAAPLAGAQVVGIGSNPQGSFVYAAAVAVARVMEAKGGLTARVQPMSGSTTITPLVNRGEIEFGMLNSFDVVSAFNGVNGFDRPNPDLRVVGVLFILRLALGVPNDSPVKSIADLKGLRMPSDYSAQKISNFGQGSMLATAGLSIADMKQFPVSDYMKGMRAVAEGKVDAALFGVGSGASQEAHAGLASRGGVRFLSIPDTPEALTALRKVFPTAFTTVVRPSKALPAILGPTRVMAFSMFLVASTHVSADVVFRATKAIYENKPMLVAGSGILNSFDAKQMAEANIVSFHPGAEQFYKQAGEWPPKKR